MEEDGMWPRENTGHEVKGLGMCYYRTVHGRYQLLAVDWLRLGAVVTW